MRSGMGVVGWVGRGLDRLCWTVSGMPQVVRRLLQMLLCWASMLSWGS